MHFLMHMIWLGGAPPMRGIANLHKIAKLFSEALVGYEALPDEDQPYMPLLWMDVPAQRATLQESVIPIAMASIAEIPDALQKIAALSLKAFSCHCRWFKISLNQEACFVPVLLYEDMQPFLEAPWFDLSDLQEHCKAVWDSKGGRALLKSEVCFCDDAGSISAALEKISGQDIAACLKLLTDHARTQWGAHGLLCFASDLLRLQAVLLLPGAYIDMGDVAGKMTCLPTGRRVHVKDSAFCGHQTIAIENDIFFCQSPALMKAITFGAYLWSVNTFRQIARRLGSIPHSGPSPSDIMRLVLPYIDARMPPSPDIRILLSPPFTTLANYICIAYGGRPMFEDATHLNGFFQGRVGRERLIDNVGGFTGYQKFAFYLAPRSGELWNRCAAEFGLDEYFPQLGWRAYGFGVVDALVNNAGILTRPHPLREYAVADLNRLASKFGMNAARFQRLAVFCAEVIELGRCAYFEPAKRELCRSRILKLSREMG